MTLFTENFGSLAKFVAESKGLSGLPIAFIEHPLTNTLVEAAKARAKRTGLIDEIADALTTRADILDSAYRSRTYATPQDAGMSKN